MARYSTSLTDQLGRPVPGAFVLVTSSEIGSLAVLTDDSGNPLPNPFVTGSDGVVTFNTNNGYYDIAYSYGGRLYRTDNGIAIGLIPTDANLSTILDGSATFNLPTSAPAGSGHLYTSGTVLKVTP